MATRILVVDDYEDALESLENLLTIWRFDVRATTRGAEAIRIAGSFHPDIAIVDLSLPDVDGFTVARALQELPERPLLIAVTGHGEESVRERVVNAGFDHYALKPWDPDDMHAVLMAANGRRASRASK